MTKTPNEMVLAGDIGGTYTRLGIFSMGHSRPVLEELKVYSSHDTGRFEDILERFLNTRNLSLSAVCFGIAGPVAKGRSQATNLPWEVSEGQITKRFNWPQVRLINDLSAMARAVAVLDSDELYSLNRGEPISESPAGLIAPGTGLGMALLVPTRNRFLVLPSEGGHSDFAPANKIQTRLWGYLHQSMGHVSVERVLSGPGLVNIYNWLGNRQITDRSRPVDMMEEGDLAKAISRAALEKRDPVCIKALDVFISILGAAAGNLALIGLTRHGIYLGGGISPKILPNLKDGLFMNSFKNKGRFRELLESIPVFVILNEQTPLLGAAVCAFESQGHRFHIRR